jgi:hypothetical protein
VKPIKLIRHEDWNSLMDVIGQRLPLNFKITRSKQWPHPWTITPMWDNATGQWIFYIKPGFVNGVEVTAPTRVKNASSRTIARLEEAKEDTSKQERVIDAFLTEWPKLEVGPTRVIGTGADATGISGSALSGAGIKLSYEPVPKFFTELGVTSAQTQVTGNLSSGISFVDGREDSKTARRLRACDISLWKDRPAARFEVYPGSILDGSLGSIYITYGHSAGMKKNPYLRISSKFSPPPEPESEMALLEGITDPEYDLTKIATIYFVSPEGVDPSAPLDSTWAPYVEYNHFWNLAHSPQNIPDGAPIEPIMLTTALAGGVANFVIATILAPLNNQLNTALQILKSRNMRGRFWSL